MHELCCVCRGVKNPRDKTQRAAWRADPEARARVTASIVKVLKEMWDHGHEIPVIASFRKEVRPAIGSPVATMKFTCSVFGG